MINIDGVYVIALPERESQIVSEFNKYGVRGWINPKMFKAHKSDNGIKSLQEAINAQFRDSLIRGERNILIFEDDCEFIGDHPIEKMIECVEELPFDYDCLQFGANMVTRPKRYSDHLFKVDYTHSTHCVLYSQKAMRHILSILDYKTHLDTLIHKYIQPLGNCYCSSELIVNQRDGYSFIEKRNIKYGTIMKDKFNKMTAGL